MFNTFYFLEPSFENQAQRLIREKFPDLGKVKQLALAQVMEIAPAKDKTRGKYQNISFPINDSLSLMLCCLIDRWGWNTTSHADEPAQEPFRQSLCSKIHAHRQPWPTGTAIAKAWAKPARLPRSWIDRLIRAQAHQRWVSVQHA